MIHSRIHKKSGGSAALIHWMIRCVRFPKGR